MSDKATQPGKHPKQPFDKNHPKHPDYTGDNPEGTLLDKVGDDVHHWPSTTEQQHEQDQHAEQQLKQQEQEQNERSTFQKGSAQKHQQGNRQK